jgi:tRNA-dihydrouridine synthase
MYKGEANWDQIAKVKNNPRLNIPVFANGDIDTPKKVKIIRDQYGLDGAMIGRASIGNPWFFNQVKRFLKDGSLLEPPSLLDRVKVTKEHLKMAVEWKGETLGVLETRRHYSNYFRGIPNFKKYRTRMVTSNLSNDVFEVLDELISKREKFVLA